MAGDRTVTTDAQERLIQSLRDPRLYGDGDAVRLIETHISYVVLTGRYAYKIKKAINLGFLDFTTLDARRFYCERELALNRRSAPSIYLEVVAITGTAERPVVGGSGPALEYAVRMREFPQDALLERVLARGALMPEHVDTLAATVAGFHEKAARIEASSSFGTSADVWELAVDNFVQLEPLLDRGDERIIIGALRAWTESEHARRAALFDRRKDQGYVRECHGDLHLGNMALIEGAPVLFDCIEFNDRMRWTDVMNDVAFTWMDFQDRGAPRFAHRFLNRYLEHSGDYGGVRLLRFCAAYRAMVRAKVARLRASQAEGRGAAEALEGCRGYLALASQYARPPRAAVIITHGLTGSGKTTASGALLEHVGAIRIRTDVERKRLHGLDAVARTGAPIDGGLYALDETERTYDRVRQLARDVVDGGSTALVDGAFLHRWQRDALRALAGELPVPFVIVDFVAAAAVLRQRVERRRARDGDASDADTAVLDHQLRTADPLAPDEQPFTVQYDAERPAQDADDPATWDAVLAIAQPRLAP